MSINGRQTQSGNQSAAKTSTSPFRTLHINDARVRDLSGPDAPCEFVEFDMKLIGLSR
jgi:hypothetical protein